MNILIAAGHLPDSQGRQAGARHSFHVCEHLARDHRVHLLAFATQGELAKLRSEDLKLFASWKVIPITNRERMIGALSAPQLPLSISARTSGRYGRLLRELLRTECIDSVVFDHTAMFQYVSHTSEPIVTLGKAHDILAQSWQRKVASADNSLRRAALRFEQRRVERWERKMFAALDYVMVLSEKDRSLVKKLQPDAKVIVVDLWMDPVECADRGGRNSFNIVFWGALDRVENADAARWAAREILPRVRDIVPSATLYIAGSRGELLAPELSSCEGVIITGFVDNVEDLMSGMDVALLPLRLGAGVKMKTLECMSAGLPVVTTSVGAEGIDGVNGTHFVVAETTRELASRTIDLLCDRNTACSMGAAGREFLRTSRSFTGRMQIAEDRLVKEVEHRKSAIQRSQLEVECLTEDVDKQSERSPAGVGIRQSRES